MIDTIAKARLKNNKMEITATNRTDARSKNIRRYFNGVPCLYGHIKERLASDVRCCECTKLGIVSDFVAEFRKCLACLVDYIAVSRHQKYCSLKCRSKVASNKCRMKHSNLHHHIRRLLNQKNRKNLTKEFILSLYEKQKGLCALSGIPLTWQNGNGRVKTNLSIDRISSYVGYTEENIQLVCRIVNIMKNQLGQLEFIELCRKISTLGELK